MRTWTLQKKKRIWWGAGAGRAGWGSWGFGRAWCERKGWKNDTYIYMAVGEEQGTSSTPGGYCWSARWKPGNWNFISFFFIFRETLRILYFMCVFFCRVSNSRKISTSSKWYNNQWYNKWYSNQWYSRWYSNCQMCFHARSI